MNLYFLRHGQSETNAAGLLGGRLDKPLTPKGIEQANSAIQLVKAINPDLIFYSPLVRAKKTAEIIAEGINFNGPFIEDARLIERGAGVLEGAPDNGGQQLVSNASDDVEGVETRSDLHKRADEFLSEISLKYSDKTILIVGHGAHIKMMISIFKDIPFEQIMNQVLPNSVPFQNIEEVS